MAHIHTGKGEHDLTVSAYIIRIDFDEPKLMLHLHKKLNAYIQFGGHVELHENPWQTITHELKEESGYTLSQLQLLQPMQRIKHISKRAVFHPQPVCINTHPFSSDHSHTDIVYAFVATEEPSNEIDAGESQDIRLFSREELLNIGSRDIYEDIKAIGLYVFDEVLPHWEQVSADTC